MRDTAWVPVTEEEGGASGNEEVVQLEDAVELLVEHLVAPVLPRGQVDREEALSPETQEAVARQVGKLVLDPLLLFVSCDSLAVGFWSIGVEERSMGLAPPPRAIYSGGGFGSRGVLRAWSIRTSRLL